MFVFTRRLLTALAVIAATRWLALPAAADPIPPGWEASGLQPVGFSGLGGHSAAFKIAIKHGANGHWYLFLGHSFEAGWSIVDVTDPKNPRYVRFIPGPQGNTTSQVSLHGNLLVTGLDVLRGAPDLARPVVNTAIFWDISDPENPKQLSLWKGGSGGSHRNAYPGGRYAFLSTTMPGFTDRIMEIVDVSDPRHPVEAGRWWQPGQKDGESWVNGKVSAGMHGPVAVSPDGKMASVGYDPDIVNLDISDIAHPKLIGSLTMTPPFADNGSQSEHTVLPFWDRKLLYVSSEASAGGCDTEPLNYAGFVDNRNPAKPRLISIFPPPRPPAGKPYTDFCDKGGRFGPHNVNTEIHNPDVMPNGNTLYIAYFNAGVQAYDITDAHLPTNTAYFIPPERPDLPKHPTGGPHESPINWCEDLAIDARGYIYVSDDKWGIWILRDPKNPGTTLAP
jgi:hypothetical protein